MEQEQPQSTPRVSYRDSIKYLGVLDYFFGQGPDLSIVEIGALCIQYAKDGQESSYVDFKPSSLARNCYKLRYRYRTVFRVAAWGLIIDEIFRRPIWTYAVGSQWNNLTAYPSMGVGVMPPYCSEILSLIFLAALSVGVMLEFGYETHRSRTGLLWILTGVLSAKVIDVVSTIVSLAARGSPSFSLLPLEGLVALLIEKNFSDKILSLLRTIPKLSMLLITLAAIVCTYAGIGFLIFSSTSSEGESFFDTFGNGVWNMLMVLNGSNWPTPMIPAYQTNRLYFIYFFLYLVSLNWGLLNLILGFVFYFFKSEQIYATNKYLNIRTLNMRYAFDVLDCNRNGYLTYYQIAEVIHEMFDKFENVSPPPSIDEAFDLAYELSSQDHTTGDGQISRDEFVNNFTTRCLGKGLQYLRAKTHLHRLFTSRTSTDIRGLLARFSVDIPAQLRSTFGDSGSEISEKPRAANQSNDNQQRTASLSDNLFVGEGRKPSVSREHFIKNSVCDPKLRFKFDVHSLWGATSVQDFAIKLSLLLDTIYFDMFMDTIFLIIGAIYCARQEPFRLQCGIVAFTLLEFVVKITLKGIYRYRRSYRNSSDGIGTIIFLTVLIVELRYNQNPQPTRASDFAFKTFVILRMTFFPRNIVALESFTEFRHRYRLALEHALLGTGQIAFLGVVLIVAMYLFAGLGLQIFGGEITYLGSQGATIASSTYGQSDYYPLNFNDILSGLVTMFVLLSVNNMHVTTSGFVAAKNTQWPQAFFALWYAIGVLFLLNVLTAFFLREFISYLQKKIVLQQQGTIASSAKSAVSEQLTIRRQRAIDLLSQHNRDIDNSVRNSEWEPTRPSMAESGGKNESVERTSIFASATSRLRMSELLQSFLSPTVPVNKSVPICADPSLQSITTTDFGVGAVSASIGVDAAQRSANSPDIAVIKNTSLIIIAGDQVSPLQTPITDTSNDVSPTAASGEYRNKNQISSDRNVKVTTPASAYDWAFGQSKVLPHVQAAIFLHFAREGLDIRSQETITSTRALFCFRRRNEFSWLFRLAAWALVILRIFERPLWTFQNPNWQNSTIYPNFGVTYLSIYGLCAIKLPVVLILILGQLLEAGYQINFETVRIKSRRWEYLARGVLFLYSSIQLILILVAFGTGKENLVIGSTYGSLIYIFWTHHRTRRKLRAVISVLPRLSILISLLAITVISFAAFGPFILDLEGDDVLNAEYFDSYGQSVWSVFVAITSSSYPGQVIPAYNNDRATCLYFIAFICLGAFGILNFILVVVLIEYQKGIQRILDAEQVFLDIYLAQAFETLDMGKKGYLDGPTQVKPVLKELYTYYRDFRKDGVPTEEELDIMLLILDVDGDGRINLQDFYYILNITRLKIKTGVSKTWFESLLDLIQLCPAKNGGIKANEVYRKIRKVVRSRYSLLAMDTAYLVLILASIFTSETVVDGPVYTPTSTSIKISYAIFFIAIAECFLKLTFYGVRLYFRRAWQPLEFVIVVVLIGLNIALLESNRANDSLATDRLEVYIRVVEVCRLLALSRNFSLFLSAESSALISKVIRKIFKSVYTLMIVFFCLCYGFMTIGVLAYGGLINESPTSPQYNALASSNYAANGFWTLNFNDYLSAFVTLFCCLHVSDFDVITNGLVAATTDASRIYFTAWYILGTLLMLNLIKSFFLTEFIRVVDGNHVSEEDLHDAYEEDEENFENYSEHGSFSVQSDSSKTANSNGSKQQTFVALDNFVLAPIYDSNKLVMSTSSSTTSTSYGNTNGASNMRTANILIAANSSVAGIPPSPVISTSYEDRAIDHNGKSSEDLPQGGINLRLPPRTLNTVEPVKQYIISIRNVKHLSPEEKFLLQSRLTILARGRSAAINPEGYPVPSIDKDQHGGELDQSTVVSDADSEKIYKLSMVSPLRSGKGSSSS